MKVALVLVGSPGSGKGTQAKFLTETLDVPQISTGEMLREEMRRGSRLGTSVSDLMKSGRLVPDELVNRMVAMRIALPDCDKGYILDGYPRTVAQAEAVKALIGASGAQEVVIHLMADYDEIVARMSGRRVCPECGTPYNTYSRPPVLEGICDLEGAKLEARDDDREEVVRARLAEYDARTGPLIDHYRKSAGTRLLEVEAAGRTPEQIFAVIQQGLSQAAGA